MTSGSSRRTWTRSGVLVGACALVVGLLPTSTAAANVLPATPAVFSYIDASTGAAPATNRVLSAADATGALNLSTLAGGVQTSGYDVSQDGSTALVAARTGAPNANPYDSTFGLVRVHRDPSTLAVTSTLLSVFWTANPVLSADGSKAFWFVGSTLYQYDAGTGATSAIGAFAPAAGEMVTRIAVSGDGSKLAVIYTKAATRSARVVAAPTLTGPAGGSWGQFVYTGATQPSGNIFVWAGNGDLVWSEYDSTAASPVLNGVWAAIPGDGTSVAQTQQSVPALTDAYDLRQDASGTWWFWKDDTSVSPAVSNLWSIPSALPVDTTAAPPVLVGPRADGPTTYRYVPSAVTPPALQTVANPAAAHPFLALSASTATYGKRVGYDAHNYYGAPPNAAFANATASEVDRGQLQRSVDGVHFSPLLTTSGASPVVIGRSYYNAYTPALTRNTWFRWVYPGDVFTAAGTSATRVVKVAAVLSARVQVSGASRIVAGGTTRRVAGTVILYRVVGKKLVKVAAAVVTAKGVYSFGKRKLAAGSYRVVTVADRYWASGFTVVTV